MEVIWRVFGFGEGNPPYKNDPILHHVHPKNSSLVYYNFYKEYNTKIYFNAEGLQVGPKTSKNLQAPNFRIAFLGDSFTEANHVAVEDSFVGILDTKAAKNVSIKNFGVTSYSPAIYYLQYKKTIRDFSPTHIFYSCIVMMLAVMKNIPLMAIFLKMAICWLFLVQVLIQLQIYYWDPIVQG